MQPRRQCLQLSNHSWSSCQPCSCILLFTHVRCVQSPHQRCKGRVGERKKCGSIVWFSFSDTPCAPWIQVAEAKLRLSVSISRAFAQLQVEQMTWGPDKVWLHVTCPVNLWWRLHMWSEHQRSERKKSKHGTSGRTQYAYILNINTHLPLLTSISQQIH